MIEKEEIDAFSSRIIYTQTKTMLLGSNMNMMMQTLEKGDGPCLPHRLNIMNTYSEMTTGSKQVAVMVKKLTTTPISISKGVKITGVIAVNAIPQVGMSPGTLEKLDEIQGIQWVGMLVEQRKEALF